MSYHTKSIKNTLDELKVNDCTGLTSNQIKTNQEKYGENAFTPPKQKSFLMRLIASLNDTMLIILMIAAAISISINVYNSFNGLHADFAESIGIFFAIALSSSISLIMEGKYAKAFAALNKIGDNIKIKVLRNGNITFVNKREITIGDIVILETGDKAPADGRLIESHELKIDESMLTGESNTVKKDATLELSEETQLADRKNMIYGGTNVSEGRGKIIVTSIGDNTEMGIIAQEMKKCKLHYKKS